MRPVFADPKTDFVFKRIFGAEVHKRLLIRWWMQEQHSNVRALSPLPKYRAGEDPQGLIDRWACFFREAENLDMVPSALSGPPFSEALEVARIANFTAMELEIYDQSKIAEQDARGALSLAVRQGREEGLAEGREEGLAEGREEGLAEGREEGRAEGREEGRAEALRLAVRALCGAFGIEIDARREATLATMGAPELEALQQRLLEERSWG